MWGGPSYCWLHDLLALAAAGQLCFSLAKSLGSGLACLGLYSLVSTLPVGGHLLISVSRCLAPLSTRLPVWGAMPTASSGIQSGLPFTTRNTEGLEDTVEGSHGEPWNSIWNEVNAE